MTSKRSDQEMVIALAQRTGLSNIAGRYDEQGNVIELRLSNRSLAEVPLEVLQFPSLQRLFLHRNQIRILPPEIGQLKHLQLLGLSHNRLSELPPEIADLTNLTSLDVSYNELRTLPVEIGSLGHLLWLDVSFNLFAVVPPPEVKPLQQHCVVRAEMAFGPGWDRLRESLDRIEAFHATSSSETPAYRYLIDPPGDALITLYKEMHPDVQMGADHRIPVLYARLSPASVSIAAALLSELDGNFPSEEVERRTERCLHLLRRRSVECVVLGGFEHLGELEMQREFDWLKTLFVENLKTMPLLLIGKMSILQQFLACDSSFGVRFQPIRPY